MITKRNSLLKSHHHLARCLLAPEQAEQTQRQDMVRFLFGAYKMGDVSTNIAEALDSMTHCMDKAANGSLRCIQHRIREHEICAERCAASPSILLL